MRRFVFKCFIVERGGEGMHAHFTLTTVSTGAGIFSEHSGAKIKSWSVNTVTPVDEPRQYGALPFG
jgi:hypothetical protein